MSLLALADRNAGGLELLDDYIEAHVHGAIRIDNDVEAIVLDPSHAGTAVEEAAAKLPCVVEWHGGFRLPRSELARCEAYRGARVAELLEALFEDELLTPRDLGRVRGAGLDPRHLKQAWHCMARFGGAPPEGRGG